MPGGSGGSGISKGAPPTRDRATGVGKFLDKSEWFGIEINTEPPTQY